MDIKERYSAIAKTHSLPKFEEMDSEFELHDCDGNHVLKSVLKKMAEKLEFYVNLIADILQPDASNIAGMHETGFFTSKEKSEMYELIKKLMKTHRAIVELCLENNEKAQAQFLRQFFSEWKEMKKELLAIIKKVKECWEKDAPSDEKAGYFG